MLTLSIHSTLSVFCLIITGYILARTKLIKSHFPEIFSEYVFYVALPVEIFLATSAADDANTPEISSYLQSYALSILLLWILIVLVYKSVFNTKISEIGFNFIAIGQTNTAFLAAPIFILLFGNSSLVAPIIFFQSAILTSLAILTIEAPSNKYVFQLPSLRNIISTSIKNPLILSALLGFILSKVSPSFAQNETFITHTLQMIANTAAPIALLALGASCYGDQVQKINRKETYEIISGIFIKSVAHPALSFFIGKYIFNLSTPLLLAVVLISAMPSPKNTFILAKTYNFSAQKFNIILIGTTAISFFSINLIAFIL
ncbi:AEC family transporter [Pseudomonas sp. MWU12-2345]|uniref:AEC family transporter n=1 Tax=Pseudomonas sp. MWU12-2345 TaxID=2928689 RepID=UPI00200F5A69|nr:AEC family transporter [Pseudomonas sp. MWU12-2345]